MSPEERSLLERSLELAEENNRLLKRVDRRARWSNVWGFIKLVIIALPLMIGYFYLEPYLNQAVANYKQNYENIRDVVGHIDLPI